MSRSVENILLQVNHVKHKKYEGTLYLMGERLAWMASHKNDTFSGMYFFFFSKPFSKLYKIFWIHFFLEFLPSQEIFLQYSLQDFQRHLSDT